MKHWLSFLTVAISAILASCATEPKPLSATLPGFYTMTAGGFNEKLTVDLKKDFTYSMDHQLISCTDLSTTFSREEGIWRSADGLVLLEPKARTEGFPDASVFAPAAFRRLVPKADENGFYLVHPDFPTRCVLTKGVRPEPEYTQKKT